MNWGRWNHNTSRIESLIEILRDEGYSIQLKHQEDEVGEGWVELTLEDGTVLARSDDVQHNKNFHNSFGMYMDLAREAMEKAS